MGRRNPGWSPIFEKKHKHKSMSKIATVNIIQLDDSGNISSVRSWADTPEGNEEAEKTFIRLIKNATSETAYEQEEFQAMLDEGRCDDYSLGFKLSIVHSEQ